jgi:hypothetical protein
MNRGLYAATTQAPELEKLSQLRAKTDRQIVNLLRSNIEAGLKSLTEVQQLLPVLNEQQRRELDPKLVQLREALSRLGRNREGTRSFMAAAS